MTEETRQVLIAKLKGRGWKQEYDNWISPHTKIDYPFREALVIAGLAFDMDAHLTKHK